jgi:hypothetical protein
MGVAYVVTFNTGNYAAADSVFFTGAPVALAGVVLQLVCIVLCFRKARPGSWWARRFYRTPDGGTGETAHFDEGHLGG